jgi:outer membrane protein insertion porin family
MEKPKKIKMSSGKRKELKMTKKLYFFGLLFLILAASCSVKRYIPEHEKLYRGAAIDLVTQENKKEENQISDEIDALMRPKPNQRILGIYPGLWAYFRGSRENAGFIARFLKDKIGEQPIYLSQVDRDKTMDLIRNRLENRGFFHSLMSSEIKEKRYTASIDYAVELFEPYRLVHYSYEGIGKEIDGEIQEALDKGSVKLGMRFDLDVLQEERVRLDEHLKNRGYYNFNPDFLVFEADTNISSSDRNFDLFLRLKRNVPEASVIPYTVDQIKVFPNYSLYEDGGLLDTLVVNHKEFIQGVVVFKPKLLDPYILIQKGERFNPIKSRLTSNRLSSIGNYRFVNLRYEDLQATDSTGSLYANIYLSPLNKRSVRAELQGVSKSNNFAGPAFNLTFRNRNLFLGGETFQLSSRIAYETQVASGDRRGLNSLELGLKADLIFPRVVFFIPVNERFHYSVPKTKITLGTEYQNRGGLYRLNTLTANYGYFWNANRHVYHEINPLSINLVNLSRTSEQFEDILNQNPFLRNSFEQQFIAGLNYTFNFNHLMDKEKTHGVFIGTTLDFAGNSINFFNRVFNEEPYDFFGLRYAQYSRADVDLRYYFRMSPDHLLAYRLFGGVGVPYGNSTSLPFVKQFFAGGPNSVRAFRIRSLGPGTYRPEQFDLGSFFDQAGDIRIEGNLEYRFPIVSILKGAFFVDAGNVWLMNENEALPGGKFSSNWMKEMAVGAGFGLRFDVDFFVIRFDFATPLRKPYLQERERWIKDFSLGSGDWRRENLIFNFAIGYPF